MAVIDSDAGEIVIRLVYDGPPEAGKTTSLRALAGSLTRPSQSPAEDDRGRTLWFDWMEYIGGRFEGCQIRCQIVSVAGQRELAARRRRVIAGADVVVFVADSAAGELATTMAYLGELREMLAEVQPPVGVILQANKRDLPDAVPLAKLRTAIAELGWPVGVVESTAAAGTGIRETFVYAVRLALDRVREQLAGGPITDIPAGTAGTADQLLAAMRADEAAQTAQTEADLFAGAEIRPEDIDGLDFLPVEEIDAHSLAAELFRDVIAAEPAAAPVVPAAAPAAAPATPVAAPRPASLTSAAPRPPTPSVPSGAIWPPVEGRAILQELAAVDLSPRRLSTGDWVAGLGTGWRVMSNRDAIYDSLDDGRAALIQWARLHSTAGEALSTARCIVLADDGTGAWRLWQLVRADPSLRDDVDSALHDTDERDATLAELRRIAEQLIDADTRLAALAVRLPATLDNLAHTDAGVVYIGFMPPVATPLTEPRPRRDPRTILRGSLEPLIARDLRDREIELDELLGHAPRPSTPLPTIPAPKPAAEAPALRESGPHHARG